MHKQYELIKPDLTFDNQLGSGTYADVYDGYYKISAFDMKRVAIKSLPLVTLADKNAFKAEVNNHIFLTENKVPHVVAFYGYHKIKKKNIGIIIMELCSFPLSRKITPILCDMIIQSLVTFKSGRLPAKNSYILLDQFYPSGSFFYYASQGRHVWPVAVNIEQYVHLKKIYDNRIQQGKALAAYELRQIKKITGHRPFKQDGLSFEQIRDVVMQIAEGLVHCAKNNFRHCDLKPENILLREEGRNIQAKICDFGLSFYETKSGVSGSPFFMAPELLDMEIVKSLDECVNTLAADAYAFYMLLFCILVMKNANPYILMPSIKTITQLHKHVSTEGKRPYFPAEFIDKATGDLLQAGWNQDPLLRPNAIQTQEALAVYFKNKEAKKHQKYNFATAQSVSCPPGTNPQKAPEPNSAKSGSAVGIFGMFRPPAKLPGSSVSAAPVLRK